MHYMSYSAAFNIITKMKTIHLLNSFSKCYMYNFGQIIITCATVSSSLQNSDFPTLCNVLIRAVYLKLVSSLVFIHVSLSNSPLFLSSAFNICVCIFFYMSFFAPPSVISCHSHELVPIQMFYHLNPTWGISTKMSAFTLIPGLTLYVNLTLATNCTTVGQIHYLPYKSRDHKTLGT